MTVGMNGIANIGQQNMSKMAENASYQYQQGPNLEYPADQVYFSSNQNTTKKSGFGSLLKLGALTAIGVFVFKKVKPKLFKKAGEAVAENIAENTAGKAVKEAGEEAVNKAKVNIAEKAESLKNQLESFNGNKIDKTRLQTKFANVTSHLNNEEDIVKNLQLLEHTTARNYKNKDLLNGIFGDIKLAQLYSKIPDGSAKSMAVAHLENALKKAKSNRKLKKFIKKNAEFQNLSIDKLRKYIVDKLLNISQN